MAKPQQHRPENRLDRPKGPEAGEAEGWAAEAEAEAEAEGGDRRSRRRGGGGQREQKYQGREGMTYERIMRADQRRKKRMEKETDKDIPRVWHL